MKQLQNNFTTQEQSEKLLAMGIPANTADFYYERHSEIKFERMNIRLNKIELADDFFEKHSLYTPHWSTGRLMEIYDICFIYPKSRSSWCAHTRVKGVLFVNYILDCYKNAIADKLLDFSKLEEC